jgi:hypothetical protein
MINFAKPNLIFKQLVFFIKKKIKEPWNEINAKWTNDTIRVKLKTAFFVYCAQSILA